jgi:hypothetical protein
MHPDGAAARLNAPSAPAPQPSQNFMDAQRRSWRPLARLAGRMSGISQTKTRGATVSTEAILPATSTIVWAALLFYEEVTHRPPLLLQALLPHPLRSEGDKRNVGSILRCTYREGHLLKIITDVDEGHMVAFDVCEQELRIAGGARLLGGSTVIQPVSNLDTRVTLTTRYTLPEHRLAAPRCWISAQVTHAFHRHLMEGIRRVAEDRDSLQSQMPRF